MERKTAPPATDFSGMETIEKTCLHCNARIRGRVDKKFCDSSCRNAYNNRRYAIDDPIVRVINNQLRKNRAILKQLLGNRHRRALSKDMLSDSGFRFQFFTHQLLVNGQPFSACYDVGFSAPDTNRLVIIKRLNPHPAPNTAVL